MDNRIAATRTGSPIGTASPEEIRSFTWYLGELLELAIPVDRSLEAVEKSTENPALKRVANEIKTRVRQGHPFSSAMERHQAVFSTTFVKLVQAGESAGLLPEVFRLYRHLLETSIRFRSKFDCLLLAHPRVFCLFWTTLFFALLYNFPPTWYFGEFEVTPFSYAITVIHGWAVSPAGYILALAGFAFAHRAITRDGEPNLPAVDSFLLAVPVAGSLIRMHAASQSLRVMNTFLVAGVPILETLAATAAATPQAVFRAGLQTVRSRIRQGASLALAIREAGIFPNMAESMIRTGEENGDLAETLHWLSEYYERETERGLDFLSMFVIPIGPILHLILMFGTIFAALVPLLSIMV